MTSTKRRLGRTSVFLLVGVLTLLPISASAAPSQSAGGNSVGAYDNGNSGNSGNSENSGGNGNSCDENSNSGDNSDSCHENSNGNSGNKNTNPGDNSNSGNSNPGDNSNSDNSGNENSNDNSGNKNTNSGDNSNGGPPRITPSGTIPNQGLPASITPSGVVPTDGGLGSVNVLEIAPHLGAAIVMFRHQDEDIAPVVISVEAPPTSTRVVSGTVIRVLTPVISPALANVIAAPLVVVEALIDAMATAGQAIVIPFIAGAAVLLSPGLRRKNLLDAALDGESKKSDDS